MGNKKRKAHHSAGEIILNSLNQRIEYEKYPDIDVVFGSLSFVTGNFFEYCSAIALGPSSFHIIRSGKNFFRTHVVPSSMIKKHVWASIGGFSEDVATHEDIDFIKKIREKGFKTGYAFDAHVRWIPKGSYKDVFMLGRREGRDIYTLMIERKYIGKLIIYMTAFLFSVILGVIYNGWFLLGALLLLSARVIKRLINSPDISRKLGFNIGAFVIIAYMLLLHSSGVLVGYFGRMLNKKYLKLYQRGNAR